MHDPCTVAFDIRTPWGSSFITVWHVDPCKGGSDNSCGFGFPRLTERQSQAMKDLGWWEGRERHFLRYPFKEYRAEVADREALYRAAILGVARALRLRMSFEEAAKMASEKFAVGGVEGPDRLFCFLPGYHSNYKDDRDEDRADIWRGQCAAIARTILFRRRRWWQHPRWHVHHWKIQIHPWQRFRKWVTGADQPTAAKSAR